MRGFSFVCCKCKVVSDCKALPGPQLIDNLLKYKNNRYTDLSTLGVLVLSLCALATYKNNSKSKEKLVTSDQRLLHVIDYDFK